MAVRGIVGGTSILDGWQRLTERVAVRVMVGGWPERTSWRLHALLTPQRDDRVDAERPPRRQIAGEERDAEQQRGDQPEAERIERRDAVELRAAEPRRQRAEHEAGGDADARQRQPVPDDERQHVGAPGAE